MKITFGGQRYQTKDEKKLVEDFGIRAIGNYTAGNADLRIDRTILDAQLKARLGWVFQKAFQAISKTIIGRAISPTQVFSIYNNPGSLGTGLPKLNRNGSSVITGLSMGKGGRGTSAKFLASRMAATMSLHWKPLAPLTIRAKKRTNPQTAMSYFVDTGHLAKWFSDSANQNLGTLRLFDVNIGKQTQHYINGKLVTANRDILGRFTKANKGVVQTDSVNITLLPDVTRAMMPALYSPGLIGVDPSLQFEAAIGLGAVMQPGSRGKKPRSVLEKLRGQEKYNRPLVQPIMAFYARHEAPAAINEALMNSIKRTKLQ